MVWMELDAFASTFICLVVHSVKTIREYKKGEDDNELKSL